MRRVMNDYGTRILDKPPNPGCPELRDAIRQYLARNRRIYVGFEQIVVGSGAEYLYGLIVGVLGREKIFALESPSYEKIEQVYNAEGVTYEFLPLGADGIENSALAKTKASVLHISPYRSFPSGITASASKKYEYIRWAQQADRFLIEDDYDSEFRFAGKVIPTMASMDVTGRVIYLNTFSKTISPALRISYLILPPALLERYREKLGFYSCTVPSFEQLTLARFLDEGYFEKHVSRMKRRYRLLRQQFLAALEGCAFGQRVQVLGDEAGLHMLLRLQTPLPAGDLARQLQAAGVPASPLERYQFPGTALKAPGEIVLSYAELSEAEIPRVLALLETLTAGEDS